MQPEGDQPLEKRVEDERELACPLGYCTMKGTANDCYDPKAYGKCMLYGFYQTMLERQRREARDEKRGV